jgi:hypothetical protein
VSLRISSTVTSARTAIAANLGDQNGKKQVEALWASWYQSDTRIVDQIRHCEIIHLFPSEHLGNFATGTLNFTGKKASWLISLGEADMKHLLDEMGA